MSARARLGVLIGGVVSLVVLAPVLTEVYASFDEVASASVWWLGAAVLCTAGGFVCCWALQRVALRCTRWSDVVTPHLASQAASNLLPAGSALGAVVQFRLLAKRRIELTRSMTALTITGMLTNLAALLVFPFLLVLPAGDLGEVDVAPVARIGLVTLVFGAPLAYLALRSQRPMVWVARMCQRSISRVPWCRPPADLADRIVAERDRVRDALARRKGLVTTAAIGRAVSDYLTLYASLLAVGLRPSPVLVLVAMTAANTAGMIPFTPGGLGFVEAGLGGALLVAGAPEAQAAAAVAIYRLVSCWLPSLAGVVAYASARRSAGVAPVAATSASGDTENTCLGVPAAAQMVA